jgi:hypothetical protein
MPKKSYKKMNYFLKDELTLYVQGWSLEHDGYLKKAKWKISTGIMLK